MMVGASNAARGAVQKGLGRYGYQLTNLRRPPALPPDCDEATRRIVERVRPFTLTPPERIMAVCEAVRYIERAGIPGSIVECGVWRGGSMMAAAFTLIDLNATPRELFLYDTFTEFPEPEARDRLAWSAATSDEIYRRITTDEMFDHLPVDQVVAAITNTGYPEERINAVQGLVEDTIPDQAPDEIALCRLDTDWYRSTLHELEHLFPRIAPGGVLIIDDYGEFVGAREAVDEYFADGREPQFLHRVDASCRLIQKR